MRTVDRATCQRGNRADESDTLNKDFWGEKMNWRNLFYLMMPLAGFGHSGYDEELDEFEIVFCYDESMRILQRGKEIFKI